MLHLSQNEQNELIIRLHDLPTQPSDAYKFVFEHEQQRTPYDVELTDVSAFKYRYSQFVLTLPDDIPTMTREGEYSLKVYSGDELVWTGKAKLAATEFDKKVNEIELGNNEIYEGDRI
jgi:hypothetical protein